MSVWWRDHADHHMGILLSADGPFKGCKPVNGGRAADKLKALPCAPPHRVSSERAEDQATRNHFVLQPEGCKTIREEPCSFKAS